VGVTRCFLQALVAPELLFRRLSGTGEDAPGGAPALFALVGGMLSFALAWLVVAGASGGGGRTLFSMMGIALPVLAALLLVFKAGIFHLFAGLWGCPGGVRGLLLGLMFSFLPFAILLPAALLLRGLGLEGFFFLFFLAALVWGYRLEVLALAAAYDLPRGRAFALFLLPFAVQALVILVLLLGVFSAVTGIFLSGFGLL
jgi:hypothetical protein